MHPTQITRDLHHILGELYERDLDKAEENRLRMLGEIAWQKQELRAAWDRSKNPKDWTRARRTEGHGKGGEGERRDVETVTEERDGDPKFMAELIWLEQLEAKLLGLFADIVNLASGGGPTYKLYGLDPNDPGPEDAGYSIRSSLQACGQ